MKLPRRKFLSLTASAIAAGALPRASFAQSFPARPVRIIVGQAAGSSSDITARLVGQFASERLGQQFIVEVRPGAAAADPAVKARFADLGAMVMMPNTPAEFGAFIAEDAAKWAKVINASGIKPE
jgi:tripartite-type tricarboxylate transporter receptor subunit TctC